MMMGRQGERQQQQDDDHRHRYMTELKSGQQKSTFGLAEDTILLPRSFRPGESPTRKQQYYLGEGNTNPTQEQHQRIESNSTNLSFDILHFLSFGGMSSRKAKRRYFTLFPKDNEAVSNMILGICYILIVSFSIFIFVAPMILKSKPRDEWCPSDVADSWNITTEESPYSNPDHITDPCRYERLPNILYFTLEELDICRRLLISVILGGFIGYERRSADRPAGIRTMGLVSLGSCFFTVSSMLAFKSSTQSWDSSRVAAALPSGVGFLGAALIWKGSVFVGDQEMHQVHGLTTAASLWLSAAIGVGVGGALYLVTTYVTILVVFILRYGPKGYLTEEGDDDEIDDDEAEEEDDDELVGRDDYYDEMMDKSSGGIESSFESSKLLRMSLGRSEKDALRSASQHTTVSRRKKSMKDIPTYNG